MADAGGQVRHRLNRPPTTFVPAPVRQSATAALGQTTAWTYDALGRTTRQRDPRGSASDQTFSYDALDRLIESASPQLDAPIQASYDLAGRRVALRDGSGTTSFTYDALGRITAVRAPQTGTVTYQYDARGWRSSLIYPDGTRIGYRYTGDGHLQAVEHQGHRLAAYHYDRAGRLAQAQLANGIVTTYHYDRADRLRLIEQRAGDALRSRYADTVERLEHRLSVHETLANPASASATPTATPPGTRTPFPTMRPCRWWSCGCSPRQHCIDPPPMPTPAVLQPVAWNITAQASAWTGMRAPTDRSARSTSRITSAPASQLITRTITSPYDGLYRLTGAQESPGTTYSYRYDLVGNRTAVWVDGMLVEQRDYNAADQVVGWTYDARNRLVSQGSTSSTPPTATAC
ncbi:hypothetical protein [Kallotenue papyrolyticum]|uniref:hypothetical protein n=1 Tax=Kallotenue papyrolyticum TaxID=1325125 RepID=UPI0004786219|nr:hypothetical protein [Kallotenue papyrolyticum]